MAANLATDATSHKDYENSGSHGHGPVNGATNGADVPAGYKQNYGGNPLAHLNTGNDSARFPAFGGEFQPGLYRPPTERKFANPAPLGLSAFALTTFVLSLINIQVDGVVLPQIVISLAFGYGGLVQLLAGMWEMAVGNTFGATALSSYGGFWISYAIILTPGGFDIIETYEADGGTTLGTALGFYLAGWFIFTTILLLCTLRSTVAFFMLFFLLDIAFLMLMLAKFYPNRATGFNTAGGYFGIFAAFMAWYNALAGLADDSNSFFTIPVAHFPWSAKARQGREKAESV